MIIEAKSKTFLVGEYCVMCGGSAVLLCTDPAFKLRIKKSASSIIRGIPEGSPAFTFYQKHRRIFDDLFIKFIDPYKGTGGFGASSAQFVLLYKLYRRLTNQSDQSEITNQSGIIDITENIDVTENSNANSNANTEKNSAENVFDENISELLNEYREISAKNQLVKPSGADCVAQMHNHHIYFDSNNNKIENLIWNFKEIDFAIVKTGNKLSTHEHLRNLSPDFVCKNCAQLTKIVEAVKQSWLQCEAKAFSANIMDFFHALNEIGLVAVETNKLVQRILEIEGVLAAKGCGAMAADTIVVIFEKKSKNKIIKLIKNILKKSRF